MQGEESVIEKIQSNLAQQLAVYTQLLQCAMEQQEAIVRADSAALEEQNHRQQSLGAQADALEELRMQMVQSFCAQSGMQPSVREIAKQAEPPHAAALLDTAQLLSDILVQITQINDLNKGLLKIHLDYVDHMFESIAYQSQPSNLYGAYGQEKTELKTSLGILNSEA